MSLTSRSESVPLRLARFSAELRQCRRVLSPAELERAIINATLTRDDLQSFLATDGKGYADREVFRSTHLELGCIGWRRGQHTLIHDHHASACCVLVLDGVLTNVDYRPLDDEKVTHVATRRLPSGAVLSFDRDSVHRMGNDADADLFTMHLYSPPLPPMHARIRREARERRVAQEPVGK